MTTTEENCSPASSPSLYKPVWRTGVHHFVSRTGQYFIGNSLGGFLAKNDNAAHIAKAIDHGMTLSQIATELVIPESEVASFCELLEREGLLIFGESVGDSRTQNVSLIAQQGRIRVEESFLPLIESDSGSANGAINARRGFQIEITGGGRVSHLVLALLYASGFAQARCTPEKNASAIVAEDICGLAVTNSELGSTHGAMLTELRRRSSLFNDPVIVASHSRPHLMISIGKSYPEAFSSWMSHDIPHLVVELIDNDWVEIGPLVIPGTTPCKRCIELTKRDLQPLYSEMAIHRMMDPRIEVASAPSAALAGYLAIIITQISHIMMNDSEKSQEGRASTMPLAGKTQRIRLSDLCNSEEMQWRSHPECGCTGISNSVETRMDELLL